MMLSSALLRRLAEVAGSIFQVNESPAKGPQRHARRIADRQSLPASFESLEARVVMAAVSWTGAAGDNLWHTANNWSNNAVPTIADDVTIDVAANPTIQFNNITGSRSVNSLLSRENVVFAGGTLNVATTATFDGGADATLQGGTLSGGAWNFTGTGSRFQFTSTGGTLNNITYADQLLLDTASTSVTVSGTTTFTAARLLEGNTTLRFAPGYALTVPVTAEGAAAGTRTLTFAFGGSGAHTIANTAPIRLLAGTGGNLTITDSSSATITSNAAITNETTNRTLSIGNSLFTNNATISSVGGTLTFNGTTLTNNGTIQVTGGTATVGGGTVTNSPTGTLSASGAGTILTLGSSSTNWSNSGTITLNAATLNLGGTFANFNFAGFSRTGGTVNLTGTYNNSGTLAFTASTGSWVLSGGTVNGGSITASGTNRLEYSSSGGTLSGVAVNDDIRLDGSSEAVTLAGATTFTAARLTASVTLRTAPGYTLINPVIAEGADSGTRTLTTTFGGTGLLTISAAGSITLAAGAGGNLTISDSSTGTLINNGTITNNAAGRTLSVSTTIFTNNASVNATAGTTTISPSTFTNATGGTLSAVGAGTILTLGSSSTNWSNSGTITLNTATLNLGGTFPSFNFAGFSRTGGTVNLTGTYNNPGVLAFTASTGPWILLGGTVSGGSITASGTNRLEYSASGGTLSGVAVNDDIRLDGSSKVVTLSGSTTFTAARLTGQSTLRTAPGYTLVNPVIAEGADSGTRTVTTTFGGTGLLTIGATGSITLAAGTGGNLTINDSSTGTLINNGTITNNAAGRTLAVSTTIFTNNAGVSATAGTTTISTPTFTNAATGTLNAVGAGTILTLGTSNTNWSNAGAISLNAATLNLGGTFPSFNFAGFSRTGGTVNLTGTYNNPGTLAFTAATGSWILLAGTVSGGSITVSGSNRLEYTSSGGTLNNVAISDDIRLDGSSKAVTLSGSTTFTAARLTGQATLRTAPGYTLVNPVIAEGADTGTRTVNTTFGGTGLLTIGATGSITLAAGTGGNLTISDSSTGTLINDGTITNNAAGRTLTVSTTTFTNNAGVNATAGTTAISTTTFTNAATGTLTADGAGTILTLGGSGTNWSNSGAITLNAATLNLGGVFAIFNFPGVTRTGGTINLTGTFNNPGVLALSASTGSWRMNGGTINGGSVTYAGGSVLTFGSGDGTLNNVDVVGELFVNESNSIATIRGTTTFTGVRLSGGSSQIRFTQAVYTLTVPIIAEGASSATRIVTVGFGVASTFTIAATGSIRTAAGSGAGININQSSASTVVNNGLISIDVPSASNSISVATFTNNGTLEVLGLNSVLSLSGTAITNIAGGTLTGGTWIARNGADFTGTAVVTTLNNTTVELSGTGANWLQLLTLSTIASTANFTLDANADLTIVPAGGTLTNNGRFTLGEGSTLNVTGAVTLAASSTLIVQAAGVSETTGFGRIVATGVVTLGGAFTFSEVNGFAANYFDNFEVARGSSRVGTFSSISLPIPLVDGKNFMIYTATTAKVAISAIPDFNEDGVVDFFDYLDFVDRFSNEDPSSDFNGDLTIDFFDYLDFIDYFSRFV